MNKTTTNETACPILVDTNGLQIMLSAGRTTALRIGNESGARVQVGRRVFWNVDKIKTYLNESCE